VWAAQVSSIKNVARQLTMLSVPKARPIPLLARPMCAFEGYCRPVAAQRKEILEPGTFVCARRLVKHGELLFCAGDDLHSIYTVKAGSFKSSVTLEDGREQVTGFYLPGDVAGLDAVGSRRHVSTVTALEHSDVCTVEYSAFEEECGRNTDLARRFSRLMSNEIAAGQGLISLLGLMSAEERVVTFLLGFSTRLLALGYSPSEFHLRMTREDIGDYLGLKLETVSRALSGLHDRGILAVAGREIAIRDLEELKRLSGNTPAGRRTR